GRAYLFHSMSTGWIEQKLQPNDAAADWHFGSGQVALSGRTGVVSGFNPTSSLGAAYVFTIGFSNGAPCTTADPSVSGLCADGVSCNTACNGSKCDACSVAAGAPADGTCAPLTGASCDDGNACTQADVCQAGVCV